MKSVLYSVALLAWSLQSLAGQSVEVLHPGDSIAKRSAKLVASKENTATCSLAPILFPEKPTSIDEKLKSAKALLNKGVKAGAFCYTLDAKGNLVANSILLYAIEVTTVATMPAEYFKAFTAPQTNFNDDLAIVKFLLKNGADPNGSLYGRTPLATAIDTCVPSEKENKLYVPNLKMADSLVHILVQAGADVTKPSKIIIGKQAELVTLTQAIAIFPNRFRVLETTEKFIKDLAASSKI